MLDPAIKKVDSPLLPKAVGKIKSRISGESALVHGLDGPTRTLKASMHSGRAFLILDIQSNTNQVRPLTKEEIWILQGGSKSDWGRQDDQDRALVRACRSLPPRMGEAVVKHAMEWWKWGADAHKVGACFHREQEEITRIMTEWCKAWQRNPQEPKAALAADCWWGRNGASNQRFNQRVNVRSSQLIKGGWV